MGIKTVAIHSDVDASSVSIFLLYLNQDLIYLQFEKKKKVEDVKFFFSPLARKGYTQLPPPKKKIKKLLTPVLSKMEASKCL